MSHHYCSWCGLSLFPPLQNHNLQVFIGIGQKTQNENELMMTCETHYKDDKSRQNVLYDCTLMQERERFYI